MKKISKLKLNTLSEVNLMEREMNLLVGGCYDCCGCGCNGPSSTYQNANANSAQGYGQSAGGNKWCIYWYDADGNGEFEQDEWSWGSTC